MGGTKLAWREGGRTVDLGVLAEQTCFSGKRPSEKTTIASTFRLNSQVLRFHLHGKENYQFDCGFTYCKNCLIERLPMLKMIFLRC